MVHGVQGTLRFSERLAWEDGLHAVEEDGEGEQHGQVVHGVQHDGAGREEQRDLVVEVEDEAPEDEPDHHGRRDGHHDGEPRTFAAPCAQLICYSHPAMPNRSMVFF